MATTNTIEVFIKNGVLGSNALVWRNQVMMGFASAATERYRLYDPEGNVWHVMVFGGHVNAGYARWLVHQAYNGNTRTIGLT